MPFTTHSEGKNTVVTCGNDQVLVSTQWIKDSLANLTEFCDTHRQSHEPDAHTIMTSLFPQFAGDIAAARARHTQPTIPKEAHVDSLPPMGDDSDAD